MTNSVQSYARPTEQIIAVQHLHWFFHLLYSPVLLLNMTDTWGIRAGYKGLNLVAITNKMKTRIRSDQCIIMFYINYKTLLINWLLKYTLSENLEIWYTFKYTNPILYLVQNLDIYLCGKLTKFLNKTTTRWKEKCRCIQMLPAIKVFTLLHIKDKAWVANSSM